MDAFTLAYIIAALWSSTDDNGEYLDRKYNADDLAPETLAKMQADCADFQKANEETLHEAYSGHCFERFGQAAYTTEQAGHDFWLTRNGHGAGFWDRGLGDVGDRLTNLAHSYGEINLYVGDDGKLYLG